MYNVSTFYDYRDTFNLTIRLTKTAWGKLFNQNWIYKLVFLSNNNEIKQKIRM